MKLEGEIPMESLDDSDEEDDDGRDNILCGLCRDHHPLYDDVTRPHRKKPPVEVAGVEPPVEVAGVETDDAAIQFDSEVVVESGNELELVAKTNESVTNNYDNSDNSENESLEDHFDESDMEGEELTLFTNGVVVRKKCAATNEFIDDDADNIDVGDGEEMVQDMIPGSPDGWKPPSPPDSWKGYEPKWGAPEESDVDNPGKWSLYCFCPKYVVGKREYKYHCTPCGAQVVPANAVGERVVEGWTFYYDGWEPDEFDSTTFVRTGATKADLKPESRKGSLDGDCLKKHGLTSDRMKKNDPLFFFQLLFPMQNPSLTGIENDQRMAYFSQVSICTNVYASAHGGGSGIGHDWVRTSEMEMIRWTGIPLRHGACDGKPGTIASRWDKRDPRYDPVIATSGITVSRFKEIKRYFKLNNNYVEKKKGEEGYDPCSKFDHVYKCLVHNMNYVTRRADLDGTVDETTWGFGGFMGDCGQRLINKPVSKGGQIVMMYDVNKRYPRAYVHRHSCHPPDDVFNVKGPAEIMMLVKQLDELVIGAHEASIAIVNPATGRTTLVPKKQIYERQPHIIADNFFSHDKLLDILGKKGYGMTCTFRRDRFPTGLKEFCHHERTQAPELKAKIMRYQNPIIAIKQCRGGLGEKDYTKTLVSFQSTGSTNIGGVNNLPSCSLYVRKKERGKKGEKHVWGIEDNEARGTYLYHYNSVDVADHMVKNTSNKFISWKYWHSPYLHAIALGVIAAFDMYRECCEGKLDESWFITEKKRLNFEQFRMLLSEQMLKYEPQQNEYPGDDKFRSSTRQHKSRRSSSNDKENGDLEFRNSGLNLEKYTKARSGEFPRLCNSTNEIAHHAANVVRTTNGKACEVCGRDSVWRCNICGKHLCTTTQRKWNGLKCFFAFHSHEFFGLARCDSRAVHGFSTASWEPPSEAVMKLNASRIRKLQDALKKSGEW